jgi:hypothetical protein
MHALAMDTTRLTGGRKGLRGGFTLFEVALSLVLVTFGVVSVLMVFPMGIKAEQMARMRVIAGAKAQEIIDSFATSANANPSMEVEAPNAWDVPAGYRVMSPDLEARISTHRYGIMPVPLEIARRLESDNDEIGRLLDEGGQLFYSQAAGATGLEEVTQGKVTRQPDALTQRLVFAVTGYAQSNHVAFLPQKAWPYYVGYPSPPGHGEKKARYQPADAISFTYLGCRIALWEGVGAGGPDSGLGTTDADIAEVFESRSGSPAYGFKPYGLGGSKDEAGAVRYLQSALWYCARKGLGTDWYAPAEPFVIKTKVAERMAVFRALPDTERWKHVQVFRFLAHAATCLTRWKTLAQLGGQPSSNTGFTIPAAPVAGGMSPQLVLTHDKIVYYHDLCLELAMLYAASQPYDWGAPRPTQRPLFTDHPLIEYDLFSPRLTGTITNSSESAQQWRPIAARPVTTIGRSYDFPDTPIPATMWGDPANFTLARPFRAEERCRQLVFWSVDWMSYEDFETAPSAPIDASKYLFAAPVGHTRVDHLGERMGASTWPDHHIYQFRNPEKVITFTEASVPTLPTGADVAGKRILNSNGGGMDQGAGSIQMHRFLGRWGADRNFNGLLDRGTLPRSVRLRASAVSRYNFYDPRLTLKLR